jgi:hypothetical protein
VRDGADWVDATGLEKEHSSMQLDQLEFRLADLQRASSLVFTAEQELKLSYDIIPPQSEDGR